MKVNFENKDIKVIKGPVHLANFGITNLEKILCVSIGIVHKILQNAIQENVEIIFFV